jgi:hypothetical protein
MSCGPHKPGLAGEGCVIHVQTGNLNASGIGQRAKRCYSFDAAGRLSLTTPLREVDGKFRQLRVHVGEDPVATA